jgi:hypothetical protein
VFKALKDGDFYSSTGPEIKSLYLEDGVVKIKTSAAKRISLVTDRRITVSYNATDKLLTGAELSLESLMASDQKTKAYKTPYFRLEVVDKYGNRALTRAYFFDELGL